MEIKTICLIPQYVRFKSQRPKFISSSLITEREADNAKNEEQNKSVALSNLVKITTPEISQYVLDRLNANQIASFNQRLRK
jgi:hypothetical protein